MFAWETDNGSKTDCNVRYFESVWYIVGPEVRASLGVHMYLVLYLRNTFSDGPIEMYRPPGNIVCIEHAVITSRLDGQGGSSTSEQDFHYTVKWDTARDTTTTRPIHSFVTIAWRYTCRKWRVFWLVDLHHRVRPIFPCDFGSSRFHLWETSSRSCLTKEQRNFRKYGHNLCRRERCGFWKACSFSSAVRTDGLQQWRVKISCWNSFKKDTINELTPTVYVLPLRSTIPRCRSVSSWFSLSILLLQHGANRKYVVSQSVTHLS